MGQRWRVEYILENTHDFESAINVAFSKLKNEWYAIFQNGHEIKKNFLWSLNEKLTSGDSIIAVLPDAEGNGFAISNKLHKLMNRPLDSETEDDFKENLPKWPSLVQRIQFLAKRDEQENLLLKYGDF